MDKLKMHSPNKVDENIEKIGKLFPNCLTETKNENGEVVPAIDFDMLRQELSSVIVEGNEERYQFKKKEATAESDIRFYLSECKAREEQIIVEYVGMNQSIIMDICLTGDSLASKGTSTTR